VDGGASAMDLLVQVQLTSAGAGGARWCRRRLPALHNAGLAEVWGFVDEVAGRWKLDLR
jgi:hypothetical protein